jgi:hypothetical protein
LIVLGAPIESPAREGALCESLTSSRVPPRGEPPPDPTGFSQRDNPRMPSAALSAIWDAAIERFGWLRALFGSPFAFLSRREELSRAEVRDVLSLLRPIERLLRCAILILALTSHGPPPPPRAPLRRTRIASRRAPSWPGAESGAWRGVRFRVLPRISKTTSRSKARAGLFYRYPLAKRMEAVARVLADPDRFVRPLIRTLRRRMKALLPLCRRLGVCDPEAPSDLVGAAKLVAATLPDTS